MKNSLIENDLDLTLDINGESWIQGDTLKGTLLIKNKTTKTIVPKVYEIKLVYADLKKFKNLSDNSYKEIHTLKLEEKSLRPMEQVLIPWQWQLDYNAHVTGKKFSPYLLWGDFSKKVPASLMILVSPNVAIKKIIEIWETFFRFVCKDISSTLDQWLEVKLVPPASREFATLEQIILKFKVVDKKLLIEAESCLKLLIADTSGMRLQKRENRAKAEWMEKHYLLMPNFLNQEFVCTQNKKLLEDLMLKN